VQANQAKKSVIPPTQALPYMATWSVETNGMLRLDGKLYQRMDRAEFESVTQSKSVITASANSSSNSSAKFSNASSTQKQSDTPAGGVDFFGTRVRGKYICFVCDISGSMNGDKLIALRVELTRTIQSLPAGSHFQVIFFSSDAYVLEPDWVLAGTPRARDFLKKIQAVGAGGGTDPTNALAYAFTKLNPIPHELFLLTDGHFGADPTAILQQYNGGADQTRIHTIGLGQDVDASLLEELARKYGGQYRAIAAQAAPPTMPQVPATNP
jgi:Mg-chelatase subunit ChlD